MQYSRISDSGSHQTSALQTPDQKSSMTKYEQTVGFNSLLQVREVDGHKLVQIRKPWANEVEWNGPWSDSSPEWSDRMKHKLKHVPQVMYNFLVGGQWLWSGAHQYILVGGQCVTLQSHIER